MHTGLGAHRFRCTQVQVHTGSGAHRFRCTQVQVHTGLGAHRFRCTQVQVHTGSGVYMYIRMCELNSKTVSICAKIERSLSGLHVGS